MSPPPRVGEVGRNCVREGVSFAFDRSDRKANRLFFPIDINLLPACGRPLPEGEVTLSLLLPIAIRFRGRGDATSRCCVKSRSVQIQGTRGGGS